MAFVGTPTTWISGFEHKTAGQTVTATSIVIPDASVPDMGNTTDIREIYQGLCEQMFQASKAQAALGSPNVSTKMTISKNASLNTSTDETTLFYTMSFVCDGSTTNDVAPE